MISETSGEFECYNVEPENSGAEFLLHVGAVHPNDHNLAVNDFDFSHIRHVLHECLYKHLYTD